MFIFVSFSGVWSFLGFIISFLREKEQSWVGKEDLGGTGEGENMIKMYCMEIFLRSLKKLSVWEDVIETVSLKIPL